MNFVRIDYPSRLGLPLAFVFVLIFVINAAAQAPLDVFARNILSGTIEQKREALFQIRNMRSEAASRVAIPALSDGDIVVRATAASSVVFLPKDEAARLLIPLLKDKSDFVRREAALALGDDGSRLSTSSLADALERDKNLEVRSAAAAAMGKIGDPAAVDTLNMVLQKKPTENTEFIRRCAARSIGQIAQIINGFKPDTVIPKNFLDEKQKHIERPSNPSISSQSPVFRSAVPTLARVLQSRNEADDTRREAAFALGAIGDESSISALQSQLNSPDNYLAEICKEALLQMPKSR